MGILSFQCHCLSHYSSWPEGVFVSVQFSQLPLLGLCRGVPWEVRVPSVGISQWHCQEHSSCVHSS